jgi:hypothetical protein
MYGTDAYGYLWLQLRKFIQPGEAFRQEATTLDTQSTHAHVMMAG